MLLVADAETYERRLAEVTVGAPERLSARLRLEEYDAGWPERFEQEAARIRGALGARACRIEHVGSTSVPGLAAKPIIDIVLEVADSAEESAYVPDLQACGYELRIREPEWFEHRVLKPADGSVHIHVFSADCTETERMVRFRERLRADDADRILYEQTKRALTARDWAYMQQYADAKSEVVAAIMARAG